MTKRKKLIMSETCFFQSLFFEPSFSIIQNFKKLGGIDNTIVMIAIFSMGCGKIHIYIYLY